MYTPLTDACAFGTGIKFHSAHNKKYVTMASIDKSQNIQTRWLSEKEANKEICKTTTHFNANTWRLARNISKSIALILVSITAIYFLDIKHSLEFLRIFDGIIIRFFLLGIFILVLVTVFIYESLWVDLIKFHAAEHMICNAYKKLHRVPSLEELRKYSRFNTNCSTNSGLALLIFSVVSLINLFLKADIFLYGLIIIILEICVYFGVFNFVQVFITAPPTDRELNVAIEGLKAWIENEQKIGKRRR